MTCPFARNLRAFALALPTLLPAQEPLGLQKGISVDLTTTIKTALGTTSNGAWGDKCLGAVRDRFGNYWIAVGPPGAGNFGRGKLVKLDAAGAFVKSVDQPLTISTSTFGLRDLAYDGAQTIWGGCESALSGDTIFAFDIASETFQSANNWRAPAGLSVHRGLAFDPAGLAGLGTLYVSDFGPGLIVEFDRNGSIVRTLQKPVGCDGTFGLALDPVRRKLWLFSQNGSSYTTANVVGVEVSLATGLTTGTMFLGDTVLGGSPIAGGCEWYAQGPNGTQPTLVLVNQGLNSKWLYQVGAALEFGNSCGGSITMAGDAPYQGNAAFAIGLTGSPVATTGVLMMTINPGYTPVFLWPFVPGCELLVSLSEVPFAFPPTTLTLGRGQQSLPVPFGVVGTPTFQWVEIAPALNPPLRASNGARIFVGYP